MAPLGLLSIHLLRIARFSRVLVRGACARYGCSLVEFEILTLVNDHTARQPILARDLATTLCIDKSAVARAVTRLADQGMLERERAASDARMHPLRATEAGIRMLEALQADIESAVEGALGEADPGVRDLVRAGLPHFETALTGARVSYVGSAE